MQCFVSGRRTGKTTQLIKLSHDTGIPIYTRTEQMARNVAFQADRMGVTIPKPICQRPALIGLRPSQVIVDEAGGILEDVLGAKVIAASINGDALRIANPAIPNFEEIGFIDLFRKWRKARKRKGGKQ